MLWATRQPGPLITLGTCGDQYLIPQRFTDEMTYQVPGTSEHTCFGINRNQLRDKKKKGGPWRSLRGPLTYHNGRPPQPNPTPPHGMSSCPTPVAGVRGLYNRSSCVPQPFLAVSEPPKAFRRLVLARVEPRLQRVRREWAPLGCIMRSRHLTATRRPT